MNYDYPQYVDTSLLREVFNDKLFEIQKGETLMLDRLILIYNCTPVIEPDDSIVLHVHGKTDLYYYPLHAEPYLSCFLKYGLEIKIISSIFLYEFTYCKFLFNEKYRLFISGKQRRTI